MFDTLWYSVRTGRYAYYNRGALWESDVIAEGSDVYRVKVLRKAPSMGAVFADAGEAHVLVQCGKEPLPAEGTTIYVWEVEAARDGKLAVCKRHPTIADDLMVYCPEGAGVLYAKGTSEATRSALSGVLAPEGGCIVRSAVTPLDCVAAVRSLDVLTRRWREITSHVGVGRVYRAPQNHGAYIAEARETLCDDEVLAARYHAKYVPDLGTRWGLIEQELASLGERVRTPEGVELVIQHTEACWVVDVNSRGYVAPASEAKGAEAVNRIACREVLRQLALRRITGTILVDMVGMDAHGRAALLAYARDEAAKDRRVHVEDVTKLGYLELTRSSR